MTTRIWSQESAKEAQEERGGPQMYKRERAHSDDRGILRRALVLDALGAHIDAAVGVPELAARNNVLPV